MCLPVFLSWCNNLLALVGPKYSTRVWCLVECFVFVRMRGNPDNFIIQLLDDDRDAFKHQLTKLDVSKAGCFHSSDRQRLLAVIETGFGTTSKFNKVVKGIISQKLQGSSRC